MIDLALPSSQAASAFASSPLSATRAAQLFSQPSLNAYLAQPRTVHRAFRAFLQHMFSADSRVFSADEGLLRAVLVPVEQARLYLPIRAGDYTDFCASQYTTARPPGV